MGLNYTASEENYLKAIFHLQERDGTVTTTLLAEQLQTKPASVTDMMKKLDAKKLLHYKPYYGFSLSPEGRKIALGIVRRHRLWEYFLAEKLGFGWDEVHSVAEELEHVGSRKLIDRLDAYLGHPSFDPHGDPIPDSKGKIRPLPRQPLDQLPLQQAAVVVQVTNQSQEMLELLRHKNIRIGTRLEVRRRFPFDHSLEVRLRQQTITLSAELAQNIYVRYESTLS